MSSFSGPANGLQQWSGPTHVTRNPTPAPRCGSLSHPGPETGSGPRAPASRLPAPAAPRCLGLQPCAPLVCEPAWPCSLSAPISQACVCPVSWSHALSFPVAYLGGLTGLSSSLTFATSEHCVLSGHMAPRIQGLRSPRGLCPRTLVAARGSAGGGADLNRVQERAESSSGGQMFPGLL